MKITKKLELINKLNDELNKRYDESDIDYFFKNFDIKPIWQQYEGNYDEYYLNTKASLYQIADEEILIKVAEELEIGTEHIVITPPKNWEGNKNAKAFISHLSKDSQYAMKLRNALKEYNIDSFVAHEDIKPTEEWQEEITRALNTMDFFISIHTEGYAKSEWCQQEVGYAFSRGTKIIPIKFDGKENPKGFIAKYQALIKSHNKLAPQLAIEIIDLLKTDERTSKLYNEVINPTHVEDLEDFIPF